jgi:predicted transposase YbfD/YdcC
MPRNPNKIDYSGGLPETFSSFEVIEDPRTGGNCKHHFGSVLFICATGLLCGMNSFADIEDFANLQIDWFKKWIQLPNGVPRAQTFSNIFQLIDPALFNRCLVLHLGTISRELRARIIAVDGKKLCGSHELLEGAAHAVSAWSTEEGVTLAQEFVGDKTNEITALPGLLEMLDLEGSVVTLDAMGNQKSVADQIIEQGGDYLLALKGNQGATHKEAIDHFEFALRQLDLKQAAGWSHHREVDKSHGRHTIRTVLATTRLDTFDADLRSRWRGMKSLVVVECETTELPTGKKRKRDRRYYLSSLDADAEHFGYLIRSHWSIENQCHWVLDVVFGEDHNRIRRKNAPKNFATLLRVVLNMLKCDDTLKGSLRKKRRHALLDTSYREKLLSLA